MIASKVRRLARVLCALLLCSSAFPVRGAQQTQQKDVIQRAAKSIYVLKGHGLRALECMVTIDPKALANSSEQLGADDPRLKLLRDLRFSVALDENSRWTITPSLASGRPINHALDQFVETLRQTIDTFYASWVDTVVKNPMAVVVANAAGVTVTNETTGYRISAAYGGSRADVHLAKDYSVIRLDAYLPNLQTTANLSNTKIDNEFLVTGIKASYSNSQTQYSAEITYEAVDGLMVPVRVVREVTSPGSTTVYEMSFSQYQIHKM